MKKYEILHQNTIGDLIYHMVSEDVATGKQKDVLDAYHQLRNEWGLEVHDYYNRDITILSIRYKASLYILKKIKKAIDSGLSTQYHELDSQLRWYGLKYELTEQTYKTDINDFKAFGQYKLMSKIDDIRRDYILIEPNEYRVFRFQNLVKLLRSLMGFMIDENSSIYELLSSLRVFDKHLKEYKQRI